MPLVADLFGDTDTIEMAAHYRPLRGRFGFGIRDGGVVAALGSLEAAARCAPMGVILGSGFEGAPQLIEAIDRRFGIIGASAEAVRRLKDPQGFAALLADLGVPHPEIRLAPLADPTGWLSKRAGGSGGGHIRRASANRLARGAYLQRCVAGRPFSISFLADGAHAQVLATTEQWTSPTYRTPWRYGGALGPARLPDAIAAEAEKAIHGIVATVRLAGIASADLLVDGRHWWLLEINPRPGATLDLLDRCDRPLLTRHIEACRGHLGEPQPNPGEASGTTIVYAPFGVAAVPAVAWPRFVMDRPGPGVKINAGAPVCTVSATGANAAGVKSLLDAREAAILQLLYGGQTRERIARTA